MTTRLLTAAIPNGTTPPDRHLAVHGPLPAVGRDDAEALIASVSAAGLRGRGGAGFPSARKLEAVAAAASRRRPPVVIVNGTEGEPASAKDRLLLTSQPQLVLDGAVLAANAVGADEIHVVAPTATLPVLGHAIAHRGGADAPRIQLREAVSGYVAGEETAVIAHLEGRPARPRLTPPRPAESGLHGRPTLVQNVETLAHLALIVRHGADWFREQGSEERPGTTLVTLSGAVLHPGVCEVPVGLPLPALLARAGGPRQPLRALLVGGYFGAWVDGRSAAALTDSALRPLGASVGAGVIVALEAASCPVRTLARLGAWMARQSAGQCGPCVNGLDAIAGALGDLADDRGGPRELERIERWTAMVDGRGACAHPTGSARMIRSGTRLFAEELADHAQHGRCRACSPSVPRIMTAPPRRAAA